MSSDYTTFTQKQFYNYLVDLSNKYYTSASSVSDTEFDSLVEYYETKFNESFFYIGPTGKVQLPVYLGSLDKCKEDGALNNFKKRITEYHSSYNITHPGKIEFLNEVVIMEKIDGLSCLLEIAGRDVRLYTRGDGYNGTNITCLRDDLNLGFLSLSTLKTYVQTYEESILIRGEIVIKKEVFEKKYSKQFKNARNFTSGVINSKTKDYSMVGDLSFIAYEYMNEYKGDKLRLLQSIGFETPKHEICDVKTLSKELLTKKYEQYKQSAEYDIDGLVVGDMLKHNEVDGSNPKYKIAFKMNIEFSNATVETVEWNISKNGIIKPRVKIEPIELNGVTINYATGFNAKFINDHNIGRGTVVQITRSGDVIPHIQKVVKSTIAEFPDYDYTWNETGVDIVSVNKDTKEQWVKKISYMFSILDIKGLKEGVLSKLYEGGIDTDEKLFTLTSKRVKKIQGFENKAGDNVIEGIKTMRSTMTLQKLMSGCCIFENFGERKITKILDNISYVEECIKENKKVNKEKLREKLEKIGFHKTGEMFIEKINEFQEYYNKVKEYFEFKSEEYIEFEFVREAGAREPDVEEKVSSIKLTENVCMTGFRDKELQKKAEKLGCKFVDTVSKNTTILVVKDFEKSSTKMEKAKGLGIRIMSKEEFEQYLQYYM